MMQISKLCKELVREQMNTENDTFRINVNDRIIITKKSSAICFSDLIKQQCFNYITTTSFEIKVDIICPDSYGCFANSRSIVPIIKYQIMLMIFHYTNTSFQSFKSIIHFEIIVKFVRIEFIIIAFGTFAPIRKSQNAELYL